MRKPVSKYRDRKTGRFVSKKKWQRSRARGGSRFYRERVARVGRAKKHKPTRPRTLPKPERKRREEIEEEVEFGGAFDSP